MLRKSKRLTRAEFNAIFPKGKRFHSPALMLVHAPGEVFKAAAVIGKKVAKTAVARNKFRRRVYAVFEQCAKEHELQGVFICVAKEKARMLTYEALKTELRALIHKTGVLG